MSGGSWDFLYSKVADAADRLIDEDDLEDSENITPEAKLLREKFGQHLRLVAEALHDIEWVDSGDCSPGEEIDSIIDVIGEHEIS
jgi:hypothetical protein